jgi:hypothetical protein
MPGLRCPTPASCCFSQNVTSGGCSTPTSEGQDVIKLKTAAVLAACHGRVEVTISNSGALPRRTHPSQGRGTFVRLATFPADKVATIKEVTVLGGIDIVQPLTSSVIRHHPDGTKQRIWP